MSLNVNKLENCNINQSYEEQHEFSNRSNCSNSSIARCNNGCRSADKSGIRQQEELSPTAAQSCINEDARCQNLLGQTQGHDNAGTVVGNQP